MAANGEWSGSRGSGRRHSDDPEFDAAMAAHRITAERERVAESAWAAGDRPRWLIGWGNFVGPTPAPETAIRSVRSQCRLAKCRRMVEDARARLDAWCREHGLGA